MQKRDCFHVLSFSVWVLIYCEQMLEQLFNWKCRKYCNNYKLLKESFLASPAHNLALRWFSTHCSLRGLKLEPRNLLTVLERSPELTNAWGLWAFGIRWCLTEILSTPSKFSGCKLDPQLCLYPVHAAEASLHYCCWHLPNKNNFS